MPFFAILSLFPEAIEPYLGASILGSARERGLLRTQVIDFRDFTRDRHRTVDDRPFGGGPGMLLRAEPIAECIEWLEARHGAFRRIALCPSGRVFRQTYAAELAADLVHSPRVLLLAGRYEGFDERVLEAFDFERISLGDFVLAGGELPALCVVEAVARLLPGVLGHEESARQDSFATGSKSPAAENGAGAEPGLAERPASTTESVLDTPHYTRPRTWRGREAPAVLLSGNHGQIERWRTAAALERTRERRPDLLTDPRRSAAAERRRDVQH
ncbi:MAG: tRNA (guanine(37)-N(1))-methyltransferase [Planctomycetes bacterium]|nr:tRNA (guanine(37)-N(1))-methyltransferase [Planctomycetota bacterium]